jgi:hypothetical protein
MVGRRDVGVVLMLQVSPAWEGHDVTGKTGRKKQPGSKEEGGEEGTEDIAGVIRRNNMNPALHRTLL